MIRQSASVGMKRGDPSTAFEIRRLRETLFVMLDSTVSRANQLTRLYPLALPVSAKSICRLGVSKLVSLSCRGKKVEASFGSTT